MREKIVKIIKSLILVVFVINQTILPGVSEEMRDCLAGEVVSISISQGGYPYPPFFLSVLKAIP